MEDDQDFDICSTTLPLSIKFMEVTLLHLDHRSAIHLHRALLGLTFLKPSSHTVRKPKRGHMERPHMGVPGDNTAQVPANQTCMQRHFQMIPVPGHQVPQTLRSSQWRPQTLWRVVEKRQAIPSFPVWISDCRIHEHFLNALHHEFMGWFVLQPC